MFFQFCVPKEQCDFLRILIHEDFDPSKRVIELQFRRIPFGVCQASTISSLGVKLCAKMNKSRACMETTFALLNQLMVDDFVHTTNEVELGSKIALELIKLGKTCSLKIL